MSSRPSRPALAVAGIFAFQALLALLRIRQEPVQPYGWDGAWYIEHVARLEMLDVLRHGDELGLADLLPELDGYFPPLLHLVTLALGAVTGHSANAVLWQGLLWLALLAASVGASAWLLSDDRRAGWAAAAATLLLPVFLAAATRYYVDLPMTALLWLCVVPVLAWGERKPLRAVLLLVPVALAACLVKWTALVFGPPMVGGALLCARRLEGVDWKHALLRRGATAAAGSLLIALALRGYLAAAGESSSLATMLDQMWGGLGSETEAGGGVLSTFWGFFAERGGAVQSGVLPRVLWYGLSAVTTLVSLACLPALLWGLGAWLGRSRKGLWLAALTLLGQGGFIALVVPLADERFLLTALPALALLAALGWSGLGSRARLALGLLAVIPALLVSAEFHHDLPLLPRTAQTLWTPTTPNVPPLSVRGLALGGSVEDRGWSPRASQREVRQAARDELWGLIEACMPRAVLMDEADNTASPLGDWSWLFYRSHLSHLVHHREHVATEEECEKAGKIDLVIGAASPGQQPSTPACGPHWEQRGRRTLPGVPFDAVFWARSGWPCPELEP